MDEAIHVRAMAEFVHQDCVKLIGYGGAHKHSCGGGVWIPEHNFPSISNFIFSFSQQMTFFLDFFSAFEVKMRNLVYCFNCFNVTQCNLH